MLAAAPSFAFQHTDSHSLTQLPLPLPITKGKDFVCRRVLSKGGFTVNPQHVGILNNRSKTAKTALLMTLEKKPDNTEEDGQKVCLSVTHSQIGKDLFSK